MLSANFRKVFKASLLVSAVLGLAGAAISNVEANNDAKNYEYSDLDRNGERILVVRHTDRSDRGAKGFAGFILNNYGKPDYIFSTGNYRENQTVGMLSRLTGVKVVHTGGAIGKTFASQLINNQQYAGKLILIDCPFQNVAQLSRALNARPGSYPANWNVRSNNQVLQFDYRGDNNVADVMAFNDPY